MSAQTSPCWVGLVERVGQLPTVMAGGVGGDPCANQAVGPIDAEVILVAKGRNNRIDAVGRVLRRFRLTIELAPNAQVLSTRSAHWRREMLTLDGLARRR